MTTVRERKIRNRLEEAFKPSEFLLEDQSHLHAGHEGAKEGKGHFDVMIVSSAFDGKSRIDRHRMVYDALGSLVQSDIHALRIRAYSPSERHSGTDQLQTQRKS